MVAHRWRVMRFGGMLLLAMLAACQRAPEAGAPAPTPAQSATAGIAWTPGGMEAALVVARREHRPLLVYWSAAWCPYCQQIVATVFTRPEFIARSRQFVAVYLDGDEPGAQKWGERLKVQGYPTLLVLDAQGRETQRISGGMRLARYAAVLELALADLQPVDALLAKLHAGQALPAGACRRLAWNGWELETLSREEFAPRARELNRAARYCTEHASPDAERLSVFAALLQSAAEADAVAAGQPPSATLSARIDDVRDLLHLHRHDPELADALMALDDDFFKAAARLGPESDALRDAYAEAMRAAARDPSRAVADQLAAVARELSAVKLLTPGGEVPPALVAAARERVDAELARPASSEIRSGVFNAVLNVYGVLGERQRAYDVALAELGASKEPYYVKADLGELAEELGRGAEALKWRAEAYQEAVGAATRFQWGQSYASALLRIAPGEEAGIRAATLAALGELDGPDRIYRRARLRLERLDRELRSWNAAASGRHAGTLQALRDRMQQICVKIPQAEPARASCEAFLTPAA
jgi:thiol-disulfide isomerase/thioredoxin